jgi:hypothetical protein
MARSKKEQVNVKLEMAKQALVSVIQHLDEQIGNKTQDECFKDKEMRRLWEQRNHAQSQLVSILKLYSSSSKKKGSRLILAVCGGELKDGEFCLYKIRASMMMYLRGIPSCPDPLCKHHGKPLEVQLKDEEIDSELEKTLGEEILDDIARKEKRAKETAEKFDGKKKEIKTEDDIEWEKARAQDEEWLKGGKK